MRNISPTQAMARRSRRLLISGMIVLLIGLVFLSLGMLAIVIPLYRAPWYDMLKMGLLLAGGLVSLVGSGLIVRGMRTPRDNPQALRMAQFLEPILDYRYTFIRNISRRGLGYVDALLVGPNCVLVFYFFTRHGEYFSERNVWFDRGNNKLRPSDVNPTQEAAKDVMALRDFLTTCDLASVPVYAVVVLAHNDTIVVAKQPVIPVTHMPGVQEALRDNYLSQERISQRQVHKTVEAILEGLA